MEAALANIAVSSSQVVLALFNSLLATGVLWPKQATVKDGDSFGYIIIGSGAGSVVANRLTEDKNSTVLLIEAGGNPTVESLFPGLFIALQNSDQDWNFKSETEKASQSQNDENFNLAAGKSLGSSTAINHLLYARGDPCDFDSWGDVLNDSSWKYLEILKYFIKSENMKDSEILAEYSEFHGTDGPTTITREPKEASKKYLYSFEEIGYNLTIDYNTNITTGYGEGLFFIDTLRQSTAQSYLHKIKDRPNLFVLKHSTVIKILFDDTKRAYAVLVVLERSDVITLYAEREIIVSCGVYNTPKLLLLSGIGPKDTLESFNITVVSDLPDVGKNLQDHVASAFVFKMKKSLEISELPGLTTIPFPVIIGAENINGSNTCPTCQTTNLAFTHDLPYLTLVLTQIFGYKDSIADKFYNSAIGRNTFFTLVANVHPYSRGSVTLKSANYMDDPVIRMNFYEDEKDIDNLVTCVKNFLRINDSTYFRNVGAELIDIRIENCSNFTFLSDEYLRCYIKSLSTSLYHQTSTCAMGKVVDTELRVIGVKGLRIIDASIFPNITRANPAAATIAIAEKISDVIKLTYKLNTLTNSSSNFSTSSDSSTSSETTSMVSSSLNFFSSLLSSLG